MMKNRMVAGFSGLPNLRYRYPRNLYSSRASFFSDWQAIRGLKRSSFDTIHKTKAISDSKFCLLPIKKCELV